MIYEIRYIKFKNNNWNYLKRIEKNKIIIYINNKKDSYPAR